MKHLTYSKIAALGLGMLFLSTNAESANSTTAAPQVKANKAAYSLSLGTEMMTGDTTYQIGDPVTLPSGITGDVYGHFPFSQLEWPLDIWLARLDGRATINDAWRINTTLKKNLTEPSDNMIDSDWITTGNPNRLDIYSESEISSFDALIIDADIEWTFIKQQAVSFYCGLGYLYQNFDYEAELIYQTSPSGLAGYEYTGDGRTGITYEMTYSMPYLKIGADANIGSHFTMEGGVSYSPLVNAEDTDNHLLRGKIMSGDMDGDAYMVDLSGKYTFTSNVYIEAGFQYMKIDVDGDQDQTYMGIIPIGSVSQESESTQTSGFISVGYTF